MKQVLLVACTPMLQSIIEESLSNRDDVSLVGPEGAHGAPAESDVDVVLATAADPENPDEGVIDLLWRWPRSRVLVMASSGRSAVLYQLAPRLERLGPLSARTLVEAICGDAR